MDVLKKSACEAIKKQTNHLDELSQSIWKITELGFKEYPAHYVIIDFPKERRFQLEKSFKLETAFRASFNNPSNTEKSGPNILCEYDALPGIGHACGHNLIAEICVAAALRDRAAIQTDGGHQTFGQLTVIGCLAEEGLCRKADLIRFGAFDGVDIAMMVHPSQTTLAKPKYVSMTPDLIRPEYA